MQLYIDSNCSYKINLVLGFLGAIYLITYLWKPCVEGICSFLKIKQPNKKVKGNGFTVLKDLFKRGNKIYQKGSYSHKFLEKLDFSKLLIALNGVFKELEKTLGVK